MSTPFVWNVDPVLGRFGPLVLRYYGICFALALLTAFFVWYRRVRRFGESEDFAWQWLVGRARRAGGRATGFLLFYQPKVYLASPTAAPERDASRPDAFSCLFDAPLPEL